MTPDPQLIEQYRAARRDRALAVLEGLHALKHALRFGARLRDVRTRDAAELHALAARLAPDVADRLVALARPVDAKIFAELAPSPHPTGVIGLADRPSADPAALLGSSARAPVVLLEQPTRHGNIGAVVRVAAAADAAGVLVSGRHDPWHPSSLRGGAGLQYALPVASLGTTAAAALRNAGRPVVALDPAGEPLGREVTIPDRAILVFGSERAGVSDEVLEQADQRLAIPMRDGVSSLNLATAVAAALYGGATGGGDRSGTSEGRSGSNEYLDRR